MFGAQNCVRVFFFDKYDVCQRTKLHVYRCFLLFCLIFYRRFKVCWKPCTGDNNSTQVKMQTKRKAVQWINVNCSVYMKLISESGAFSIEVTFAPSLYNSIETLRRTPHWCLILQGCIKSLDYLKGQICMAVDFDQLVWSLSGSAQVYQVYLVSWSF